MKFKYIHREIEKILLKTVKQFSIVAITGPRQSGKTTLIKNILSDYNFISFDDPLNREKALSDPLFFLESAGEKAILDEIQYVPQLLSYIKIIVDNNRDKKGLFVLTGSQQFTLMKGVTETLAGRVALLKLLPFSKSERESVAALRNKASNTLKDFIHFSFQGGFPELNLNSKIEKEIWYASFLQTYLERDIRAIYDIGSLREFQRFLKILASRCSQILNLSHLANDVGVAVNTIKKWVSILEASGIIYLLYPYYKNLGKRITKTPKVYFLDSGLVCFLVGLETKKHLINGPLAGGLFENYCIQETVKTFYNQGKTPPIYYLRTHNQLEIDLIIEKNMKIYPFEIKFTKTPNIGMANPVERFKKIYSKLDIQSGGLITLAEEEKKLSRNVSIVDFNCYISWLKSFRK